MRIDLTNKRAVVTGSTSGIGFAIAHGLAEAGAAVVINGRHPNTVRAAVKRLTERAPQAKIEGIAADLAKPDGVAAFVRDASETDILVNNLGIFEPKPFDAITDDDWQRFFETNVMSGVRLSRHYLPSMVRRGWGRIVFISSESGLLIPVDMTNYGVTKTAQIAVMRGLAREFGGCGVTVNCVLPGPTRTEGISTMLSNESKKSGRSVAELEKDFFTNARPTSLIQRLSEPEEIANMVVYACSDRASSTTGASLRVEGGIVTGLG